jgi:pimeloyl-ACP methyl ester carboxylesterase
MNVTTIVLINGLWMTALSWEHWARHYRDKGYSVIVANWPGMEGDIEQLRRDPSSFATLGLSDVVDHYEQIIRELETPPVIIGYGFGGLVTQILLDRGWGAAGVGIASAPVKGIARLPLSVLKLAFSVLGKSLSNKTASLTAEQFHHAFARKPNLSRPSNVTSCRLRIGFCCKQHWQSSLRTAQLPSTFGTTRAHHCSWSPVAKIASCRAHLPKRTSSSIENRKPKPITKNFAIGRIS